MERQTKGSHQAGFTAAFERRRLSDWAITALERAGRDDEVLPLAEREAELNGDYVRLVGLLIAAGQTEAAEQWIARGMAATHTQFGTDRQLREILRGIREQAGDFGIVAAMRAHDFFEYPSLQSLQALQAAAEQAGVWPAVQAAVMQYLESGEPPRPVVRMAGEREIPAWPLPESGPLQPLQLKPAQFPMLGLLIEIAAREQQPERVLCWYDRRPAAQGTLSPINHLLVAEAVAAAYPDRAIAIWKQIAEAQIAQVQPRLRGSRRFSPQSGRSDGAARAAGRMAPLSRRAAANAQAQAPAARNTRQSVVRSENRRGYRE